MFKVWDRGNNRSDTGQEAAQKVFAAWERWDLQAVESFMADSAVDSRPQSGEHFAGRANIMAMYHEVPGPPKITWRSVRGGPKVWVGEGIVEYGEGPVHIVGIVEFADGKITMADYYFAEPFDPPASRSRWAAQTQYGLRLAKYTLTRPRSFRDDKSSSKAGSARVRTSVHESG